MKLLSICIPTYNRSERLEYLLALIARAPASVQENVDLVIADNASDDATQERCMWYAERYDCIRYHRNKENLGGHVNIEVVIGLAETQYVWLFGDDDIILLEHLINIIKYLAKHQPDVYLVDRMIVYDSSAMSGGTSLNDLINSDEDIFSFKAFKKYWAVIIRAQCRIY